MTKDELIQELIAYGYLKTQVIIEAFEKIDRRDFVPPQLQEMAYVNEPLPIGFGQTISQPLTVAFMFELLQPKANEKILDIGVGSGWTMTMLGHIVARDILDLKAPNVNPKVIGMERIPELKNFAEANISKYNFISRGIVELILGDASHGVPSELLPVYGFDKIIAAASTGEIPLDWKRQLAVNGRIVAPVKNSVVVIDKYAKDEFETKEYPGFNFVPLVQG